MLSNILSLILCFWPTTVFCLFEMCNHKVEMKAGEKLYVNSPYYPAEYPVGSSCRYVIKAPADYKLKFGCDIKINTPHPATRCQNEVFYFNPEGSEILTDSEYFCGTGKMERKSFLNQAVLSYVSTTQYKRILINGKKEAQGEKQKNKIKKTEIKIGKQPQNVTTTATKATTPKTPTTSKTLKEYQLTTLTATITKPTTTTTEPNLLTASFTQIIASTTSLPASSILEKLNMKAEDVIEKDKKVNNSFAYVVSLLSNRIDKVASNRIKLPKTTATTTKAAKNSTSSRPTSVFKCNEILPASMWRNGSYATHKISTKRAAKVVFVQDYTTSQSELTSNSTQTVRFTPNTLTNEGGGSFSCLVEVIQSQCECGRSSTAKIVGDSGVAGISEFPSMAGIMTLKNQRIFCGATIIHHRYLLSAAHCYVTPETNKPAYLTAVVGEHDLSTVLDSFYTRQYDLIRIIIHEQFQTTSSTVRNDIAILQTRLSIEWNRSVGPTCLPFANLKHLRGTLPYAGQRVETAGWGTTSFGGQQSTLLLKTTLDVISHPNCERFIGNLPLGAFCTYTPGRDTCQYDSGGALYVRGERLYAVGIVSYGFACATNQPSVNTRISSYLNWLRIKTPDARYCT